MLSALKSCSLCVSQRWVFAFMACLALWLVNALRVILSIAITEMAAPLNHEFKYSDDTCVAVQNHIPKNVTITAASNVYDWDEYTQGLILSSYFWGYAVSQFPFGALAERFGGKHLVGLGIFVPAVLTLLTPLSIQWGESAALVALRLVMGIASGAVYPAVISMIPQWTEVSERTKFGTIILAGGTFGTVFGTSIPAIIIHYSDMGWPAAFYFFGIIGSLWYPFWLLLCYNRPEKHPLISETELKYLQKSQEVLKRKKMPPAPWRHILKSKEVWAFVIAFFGYDWAYFTMATDLPKYMSSVVGFSLEDNGFLSSLPYLCTWMSSFVSSWILDMIVRKDLLSLTNTRKLFGTISIMGPALFILGASYAQCDKLLVVVMFGLGMTLMGVAFPSIMVNALDLSPNYSGTLMAFGNGLSAIGGIFAPYIVGLLTPNQMIAEWRLVFWLVFVMAVLSTVCFLLFASTEEQEWNDPEFVRKKEKVTTKEENIKTASDVSLNV